MQIPIPEIFSAYNLYLRDGRPIDEGESPETKEADNKVAAESQDTPRASDAEVRDTEEEHKGR